MTDPEITSEQAILLALMAIVRRCGGRIVLSPQELIAAASYTPWSETNPKHELIFEVRPNEPT